jgi:peptide/nickel transport system substrate-binding protein
MTGRRVFKKRVSGLLMIVLTTLTVALSGCSSDKAAGDSSSKITIGIPQDIAGLDPHNISGAGTKEVLFNLFEGLVKPDEKGNLIPAVASEYKISEDSKVYSFTLRDGIRFHDGSAVTVEDIKYSIDRNAGTDGSEPLISAFSKIDSVNIVDDKHVDIVLSEGDSDFLPLLTVDIIPKSNATPESTPIGTGPYKFVSWSPQESIVLKRFDDYWGKPAYIENVTFKVSSNPDALVMDLKGGSIDMYARLTTTQVQQLGEEDFTIYEGTMNLVQALYINNAEKPFDDVRVRQALCYAINPQEIMDFVSDGSGTEIGSAMFPSFSKYYLPELNDTYNKDSSKAQVLLAQAGYPDGFEFTIKVPSNYPQHVDTAQVLSEQLKAVGITANIQEIEWNTWLSDVYTDRNYQATVVGVDASTLSASALLARYASDSSKNFVNFKSEAYDTAYASAVATSDDSEKTRYYQECERILSEEAASVYIQDLPEFVALNKKYTGYVFYPLYVQDIAKIKPVQE